MSLASRVYEPGEKIHRNENFPVASYIIAKKYRPPVLAFYDFARAADDVADHPTLSEEEKITQLDAFEATILGKSDGVLAAFPLRQTMDERGLSPRHALDLLIAFRQDARQSRYESWDELLGYCAYSASPVGRFVLDVHAENASTWPASDALCGALQIINHLQDCRADYERLNRIYIPRDSMAQCGVAEKDLSASHATPALRQCLAELARKTQDLLKKNGKLSVQIKNKRLALEVAVIERLAERLLTLLLKRDPLSQRVHLHKAQLIPIVLRAALSTLALGARR